MGRMKLYIMSVNISAEERTELEQILNKYLSAQKESIKKEAFKIPVDIFRLATALGFDIRGAEFNDNLEGLVLVNEKIKKIENFESNKIIAYNCKQNILDKKFIVAHELAHYIFEKAKSKDKKIIVAARDHETNYSDNLNEQKIDYMAAALLVPKEDLKKTFENSEFNDDTYKKVAEKYKVDDTLAKRRMAEVFKRV